MRGTYLGQNRVLVEPTWGGRMIVPADDYSIAFDLITAGEIEPALTRFLQRTVRPGQTAVDVGANLGYHTILLATLVGPQGRVFAYEPNPYLLPFLRANVASGYLYPRVQVIGKAAYSSEGTLTFHCAKRFMGNSSIHELGPDYLEIDEVEEVTVAAEPLDALLTRTEQIDLLKMDIQGAEYHAFRGAQELFRRRAIKTLVFELCQWTLAEDWERFCDLLARAEAAGASFHTLSPDGDLIPTNVPALVARGLDPHVVMFP